MQDPLPPLFLFAALIGFYLAARAARISPRLTTFASLLPLAGVVAVASAMGRPEMALGAALSASVASLGLVAGMALLQRRPLTPPPPECGSWTLLIPTALSVLLIGLAGSLTPVSIAALLLLAAVALPAMKVPPFPTPTPTLPPPDSAPDSAPYSVASLATPAPPIAPRSTPIDLATVILATLIALLAGWAAVQGASLLALRNTHAPAGLLAACVLGPASTMPFLGMVVARATDGHTYNALGLCIRFALTSVVTLLPLAALIHFARAYFLSTPTLTMPFPATLWRVETVLLLAFSVLLIPLATGRLTPKKRDGAVLLGLYVVYLILSALGGARLL